MKYIPLSLFFLLAVWSCNRVQTTRAEQSDSFFGAPIKQETISSILAMPWIPETYEMPDWKKKARDYDAYVFDWNRTEAPGALIWLDKSAKNFPQNTFGLYTVVGDVRQGPGHQNSHEGINTIAAVLSGGLVGIDKTNQDGYNYPKMLQNYFAKDNGWKIMLNGTSGYATDWWYNMLPNILYYGVCDVFPGVDGAEDIQKSIADRFALADKTMGDDYNNSWFNYGTMSGVISGIPLQQDAAGGHGYVLLNAYRKFGTREYLDRCENAVNVLNGQKESRFYECILPFGIYTAAYLNAAYGKDYDIGKMLDWVFDGGKGRYGWGVITAHWGPYDVYGLQGSITDGGGYAFQMNSYLMAWPLVPMVKYAPEWAAAIGKWMLNNASASRLFFPGNIDDRHQYAADIKNLTGNVIGYEGLRYSDRYGKYDYCPIAEGDCLSWYSGMPVSGMFSLYSTSSIGIFGSIIAKTNVEGILRLDCNATDFYAERPYPVYLYYNPYKETKDINYTVSGDSADLFDIVSKSFIRKGASGVVSVSLPPRGACLIVEMPAGTLVKFRDDGSVVADHKYTLIY